MNQYLKEDQEHVLVRAPALQSLFLTTTLDMGKPLRTKPFSIRGQATLILQGQATWAVSEIFPQGCKYDSFQLQKI